MKIKIGRTHITKAQWCDDNAPDSPEANPITGALLEAGFSDVQFEIHLNLIPPRHDWKIIVDGTPHLMTYYCRDYYDRWRIERGSRTKPAHLILNHAKRTADIQVIRINKYSPPWVKADISYAEWMAFPRENERRAAEDRRNGYRPSSPAELQAEIDSLPDGHPIKAQDMSKWTQAQISEHFAKRGGTR